MPIPLVPVITQPPATQPPATQPGTPNRVTVWPPTPIVGRHSVTLTGPREDVITFGTGEYVLEPGWRGFGMPPVQVQRRNGAGSGSRWLSTRHEERLLDLPVFVRGADTPTFRARMTKLHRLLDDRYGPTTITVHDGFGGSRSIEAHYIGGAEGEWTPGRWGPSYARLVLSFVAPWPFWAGSQTSGGTVGNAAQGDPFIPFGPPIGTSPAQVLGSLVLVNPGDADAFPVWTITGPGGPTVLTSTTDQATLTITSVLTAGQVRVVDTAARTVVDGSGVSRYSELGAAPRFWPLTPGSTSVSITMENATSASNVEFSFRPQFLAAS